MAPRVLIVGCGNPLARDEGLGPCAVERLREHGLPEGVEAVDVGTDLLAELPRLADAGRVLIIDAMEAGGEPGTIYRMTLDELLERAVEAEWRGAHDLSLVSTLRLAQLSGTHLPPIVVFGVEPTKVALGEGLTRAVAAAMDDLLAAVLAEVAR